MLKDKQSKKKSEDWAVICKSTREEKQKNLKNKCSYSTLTAGWVKEKKKLFSYHNDRKHLESEFQTMANDLFCNFKETDPELSHRCLQNI